jgi:hypothetical protein
VELLALKVLCRVKLPYIIRIEEAINYISYLPSCNEFKVFNIFFFPNDRNLDDDLLNVDYPEETCSVIEIETILNSFTYENYQVESSAVYKRYKVPHNDQLVIFKSIGNKLNSYLKYLKYVTKMFWIEELPINPLSGVIGTRTDFAFLHPEERIGSSRVWNTMHDNFMVDHDMEHIKPLNEQILNKFNNSYVIYEIWYDYVNKARNSLFVSDYDTFIIY